MAEVPAAVGRAVHVLRALERPGVVEPRARSRTHTFYLQYYIFTVVLTCSYEVGFPHGIRIALGAAEKSIS